MTFHLVSPAVVEALHDAALNPGELPGRARDKSLDRALARVDNRIAYGLIRDVFDLAAAYAAAVAQGHCFNDGNKCAAFATMDFVLHRHGYVFAWDAAEIGDLIIRLAQRKMDDGDLGDWLRERAQSQG